MKSGNKIGTHRWWVVLTALLTVHCSLFVSKAQAQDVTVNVNPVQQVLPPQAGQYVDNPGKFFTIRLTNNTDDEQRVHLGMHIDMLYPTEQAMVATPTDNKHIPRQPIVLAPRQTKLLNPVEMKLLFTHFELTEIYIRDGMYNDYKKGIFGLLPEGQYKLYLHCYKWDPNLTSAVLLNSPNNGTCDFNVCYTAQEPKFVTPQPNVANDPLGRFAVAKVDKALPQFTWTAPTLNCNAKFINFTYDVKVVKLNGLNPDEAIERNPVIYQRNKLTTPTLTIPTAYVNQMTMDDDVVYAMQITAVSSLSAKSNQLNFTLIENDGRSDILLFRFYDPKAEAEEAEEMEKMKVSTESGDADLDDVGENYVFEQPTLIKPVFDETTARKIYVGDDLAAEWREAWLSAGKGERKDTIKFEYTYAIYKGNSADELKNIFLSKPVYTNKTKELEAKIKWDDLDGKIKVGDYLVLRVTAAPTNGKDDIRMLGDSLNYKDFALVEHFDEDWACGTNTSEVTNKKPIAKAPKAGTKLTISDWTLEVNGDVKQDAKTKALSGTGFIHWAPSGYTIRMAVKFDKLMVNTDLVVFDGVCTSYPKEENKEKKYSAQEAVDQLFSYTGLDSFWGDLQLPENVKNKVSDEVDDVAKKLKLGEYYTYFKKKQNQWNNIKKGNLADLYFPTELPKEVADKLPKDFSLQIASVQVSPKACVMNIIGEYVLPKSSIIDNDVLIFGAPRLCMTYDSFLPEDGVIALLSNFKIKDPSSDFTFTFKAPTHPLRPSDGCFLEWENNEFGGLGLNFAMTIPNLRRVVNGKAQDAPPIVDVKTVIGRDNDWNDWTARVTFDKFQIEDVPDWTFTPGEVIILDHSYKTNEPEMVAVADLPKTYDPSQVNSYTASNWKAWQGLYIKQVDVEFPKWGVFGSENKGLTVGAKNMVFDNSGCTLDIFANDMMSAKTGKCGGWEFDLDKAEVSIVQNNFDKCWIEGRFAIPLFGAKKDSNNKDPNNGKVKFTCDIRHLTEGETTYYTYDKDGKKVAHTKKTYGKDKHMAYIFRVQQVGDMDWSWCVADVDIIQDQTYFVVAAEEKVVNGQSKTDTHVELALAGDVTIAPAQSLNARLKETSKNLPIELKIPGIHFAKLRLANFKRSEWNSESNMIKKFASDLVEDRDEAEKKWDSENTVMATLVKSKELELSKSCYLDLGEWSLASQAKKLGPFEFNLKNFNFKFDSGSKQLKLGIDGEINLCGKLVHAAAGIDITAKLTIPKDVTNLMGYKLSDGDVSFRSIDVGCDIAGMLKFKGNLEAKNENGSKGYQGVLDIEIVGLFNVKCMGGYFNHKATTAEMTEMEEDWNRDHKNDSFKPAFDKSDANYAWGYFMCDIESSAGIPIPPISITRISGGFYFNCAPKWNNSTEKFDRPSSGQYGLIGASLGVGLASSAGKKVLSADLDVNVIYDRKAGHLTTFLFKGKVKALAELLEAKMTLLYQNDSQEHFLSLDISIETGLDAKKALNGVAGKYMKAAEEKLKAVKDQMDKFQKNLKSDVKNFVEDRIGNLDCLKDDAKSKSTKSEQKGDTKLNASDAAKADKAEKASISAGKAKISFQLKITWKENGVKKSPVRWHLYLGEPALEKRISYTLIDFKSPIVNVNIGANGYICIGNELPGNGALPDIPKEISDFLDGGGNSSVSTGSSSQQAQSSRKQAAAKMLGTNINGGVMIGASAWGFIDVDLGLFYGNLRAIAGFDMSFINYGDAAYCVNLNQPMGYKGWYAMGQFYAYLAAQFGLKISLGKLIKERKISILNAGIGGVFECGLPKPSWVEGRARVKVSLIGGLIDIDRKFSFSAGQYCEAFLGNALDDYNLFGEWSIGSDSIDGWTKDEYAIDVNEGKNFYFTTDASIGSQHRLVDPSTANTLKNEASRAGRTEDEAGLKSYAARTYVFNFDKDVNTKKAIGARLFKVSATGQNSLDQYMSKWLGRNVSGLTRRNVLKGFKRTIERSNRMKNSSLASGYYSSQDATDRGLNEVFKDVKGVTEIPVSIREDKGTHFTIQMNLEAGYDYVLMLTGTCYEINNGQAQWVEQVKNSTHMYEQWRQSKLIYFHTKKEEKLDDLPTQGLQPYVALAFPSAENRKLTNSWDEETEVYLGDVLYPTIALNKDIRSQCFKSGRLEWALRTGYRSSSTTTKDGQKVKKYYFNDVKEQTRNNKYVVVSNNNFLTVNMEPEKGFTDQSPKPQTGETWLNGYNLQLRYIRQVKVETDKNSTYRYGGKTFNPDKPSEGYKEEYVWKFYEAFLNKYNYKKDFTSSSKYSLIAKPIVATHYAKNIDKAKLYLREHDEASFKFDEWKKGYFVSKGTGWQNDTTYLVNLFLKGSTIKAASWKHGNSGTGYYELLPYERAFVGVRAAMDPQFTYSTQFSRYDDIEKKEQVFALTEGEHNAGYKYNVLMKDAYWAKDRVWENATSMGARLTDPYTYFAYLSHIFVSGRVFNAYSFDAVRLPHASETLSYSFNGTQKSSFHNIIGSDFSRSMWEVRQDMYKLWNTWNYNDTKQPCYPLPSGTTPDFDVTRANQDGKATTYTIPRNKSSKDYPAYYGLKEYLWQVARPYAIAQELSNQLYTLANELKTIYKDNIYDSKTGGKKSGGETAINTKIKEWSNKHRGQYLTIGGAWSTHEVKVPLYQLPLLFGACFGKETNSVADGYDKPQIDQQYFITVDESSRAYRSSVKDWNGSWSGLPSVQQANLYFWRLCGGYSFYYKKTNTNYDSNVYTNKWLYVNRDIFSMEKAFKTLTSLPVLFYRVDSYNLKDGQYYWGGYGAYNYSYTDFGLGYADPLKDKASPAKGDPYGWLKKMGVPSSGFTSTSVPDWDKK